MSRSSIPMTEPSETTESPVRYADGTAYRLGDVVLEGRVLYARPLRAYEHEDTCPDLGGLKPKASSRCRCAQPWRLVVQTPEGATVVIAPGETLASTSVPAPATGRVVRITPATRELVEAVLECGHSRTITETLAKLAQRLELELVCPPCIADRSRSSTL